MHNHFDLHSIEVILNRVENCITYLVFLLSEYLLAMLLLELSLQSSSLFSNLFSIFYFRSLLFFWRSVVIWRRIGLLNWIYCGILRFLWFLAFWLGFFRGFNRNTDHLFISLNYSRFDIDKYNRGSFYFRGSPWSIHTLFQL
jgi:hypothetical protein